MSSAALFGQTSARLVPDPGASPKRVGSVSLKRRTIASLTFFVHLTPASRPSKCLKHDHLISYHHRHWASTVSHHQSLLY
ncbi:hypothetical protein BD311DRAFT_765658 [Dichomitus squalens]|uniref:Uncharacterized protein n=1 Tax=Dichomitus squalens TaxID=114155 RepID=A0A4Q9MC72_9APHY|nr:hypothetical protein BD311DRAFT_765658 [Dichomitus squalens]